jgi:hypothetical protein
VAGEEPEVEGGRARERDDAVSDAGARSGGRQQKEERGAHRRGKKNKNKNRK